jgi:hypothetical protein
MNERTRKRIIYTLFVGAVILGLITRPWERPHPALPPGAPDQVMLASLPNSLPGPQSVAASTPVIRVEFASAWPPDPFQDRDNRVEATVPAADPLSAPVEPPLTLQGIMTVDGRRACVINGQMGPVGMVIDGWRVARIDERQVHLVRGAESIDLELP